MGQTASCGGKRVKKTLSCSSRRNSDLGEPPVKKRKNSRRNSRIFPTIVDGNKNESNNGSNSMAELDETFRVGSGEAVKEADEIVTNKASHMTGSEHVIHSTRDSSQEISNGQTDKVELEEVCSNHDSGVINVDEGSPFHAIGHDETFQTGSGGDGKDLDKVDEAMNHTVNGVTNGVDQGCVEEVTGEHPDKLEDKVCHTDKDSVNHAVNGVTVGVDQGCVEEVTGEHADKLEDKVCHSDNESVNHAVNGVTVGVNQGCVEEVTGADPDKLEDKVCHSDKESVNHAVNGVTVGIDQGCVEEVTGEHADKLEDKVCHTDKESVNHAVNGVAVGVDQGCVEEVTGEDPDKLEDKVCHSDKESVNHAVNGVTVGIDQGCVEEVTGEHADKLEDKVCHTDKESVNHAVNGVAVGVDQGCVEEVTGEHADKLEDKMCHTDKESVNHAVNGVAIGVDQGCVEEITGEHTDKLEDTMCHIDNQPVNYAVNEVTIGVDQSYVEVTGGQPDKLEDKVCHTDKKSVNYTVNEVTIGVDQGCVEEVTDEQPYELEDKELPINSGSISAYETCHGIQDTDNNCECIAQDHHGNHSCLSQSEDDKADNDYSDIERRQMDILSRLSALQKEVQSIANEAGIVLPPVQAPPAQSQHPVTSDKSIATLPANGCIHDIVVSADPADPPLSLFVLYEMLKTRYKLIGRVHVHSSLTTVPNRLVNVFNNAVGTLRSEYEVAITLIWKKVEFGPTLMVSGHSHSPIIGESSILRYLGRLLQPAYDVGDAVRSTLVDDWIDMAQCQIIRGKARERTSAAKLVTARLNSSDWLVGDEMSLADVAVWSALKRVDLSKSLASKLIDWMTRCSNMPQFQLGDTLLA